MDSESDWETGDAELEFESYPDQISVRRIERIHEKFGLNLLTQDLLLRDSSNWVFLGPENPFTEEMAEEIFSAAMMDKLSETDESRAFLHFGMDTVNRAQDLINRLDYSIFPKNQRKSLQVREDLILDILDDVLEPIFESKSASNWIMRGIPVNNADISTVEPLIGLDEFDKLYRDLNGSFWQVAAKYLPREKIVKNYEFLAARIIFYLVLLASEITRATWQWTEKRSSSSSSSSGAVKRSFAEMTAHNPYEQDAPRAPAKRSLEEPKRADIDWRSTVFFKKIGQKKMLTSITQYWTNLQLHRTTSNMPNHLNKQVFWNQPALQRLRRLMVMIDENSMRFRDSETVRNWKYVSEDNVMELLETCGSHVLRGQMDGWAFDFYVEGLIQPIKELFNVSSTIMNRDILHEFHQRFFQMFAHFQIDVKSQTVVQVSEYFVHSIFGISMNLIPYKFFVQLEGTRIQCSDYRNPRPHTRTAIEAYNEFPIQGSYSQFRIAGFFRLFNGSLTRQNLPSLWSWFTLETDKTYLLEALLDQGVIDCIPPMLKDFLTHWMVSVQREMRRALTGNLLFITAEKYFVRNEKPTKGRLGNFLREILVTVLNSTPNFKVFDGPRAAFVIQTICTDSLEWKTNWVNITNAVQRCNDYVDEVYRMLNRVIEPPVRLMVLLQIVRFCIQLAGHTVRHVINTSFVKLTVQLGVYTGITELGVEVNFPATEEQEMVVPQMVPPPLPLPPQMLLLPPLPPPPKLLEVVSLKRAEAIPLIGMLREPEEQNMEIVEDDSDDEDLKNEFGEEYREIPAKIKQFFRQALAMNETLKKEKAKLERIIFDYRKN